MTHLSRIVHNLKKNPLFSPADCPFHNDNQCLQITTNHNGKRYHCLYERDAPKWVSYGCSKSCDIPEYFYDLIPLESDHVLPFGCHYREQSGFTIGLYELKNGLYSAKILKSEHMFECFLTFVVILCEVCHLYGGNSPQMNRMKFIYAERHPVLADVGKENNAGREKIGSRNIFSIKKWNRFLNHKTTKDVLHYVRVHHPEFFKKRATNKVCILEGTFDDKTHALICKCRKTDIKTILETYRDDVPVLTDKINKLLENEPSD